MSNLPDAILLERAKAGDVAAFEGLISQHEKRIYNIAYHMTGNHADASDMAQEALIRVYTSLPNFRGESSFVTWLYSIVSNVCRDELRRRKRQPVTFLDEPVGADDGDIARQIADESVDGPEAALERVEVQETVRLAIQSLDEEYRLVVVLRDIQGLSYEEVAAALNLNLGTVKSRLNRARHQLKEKFIHLELLTPSVVYTPRRGKLHEV